MNDAAGTSAEKGAAVEDRDTIGEEIATGPAASGPLVPDHHALSVSDLGRACRWYAEKLGFRVAAELSFPEIGLRVAMLELGGYRIEVFEREGATPPASPTADPAEDLLVRGLKHVAFATQDLDGLLRGLAEKGVEPVAAPAVNETLKIRYCFVQDADGTLIELVEHARSAP